MILTNWPTPGWDDRTVYYSCTTHHKGVLADSVVIEKPYPLYLSIAEVRVRGTGSADMRTCLLEGVSSTNPGYYKSEMQNYQHDMSCYEYCMGTGKDWDMFNVCKYY